MFERPGATFTLSFLLVVVAALILYRPDPPPEAEAGPAAESEPLEAVAEAEADEPGPASLVESPPVPTSGRSWPRGRDPLPPAPGTLARGFEDRSRAESITSVAERGEPARRPVSPDRSQGRTAFVSERRPRRPGSPFTLAEPGETLADVAARVYGPSGDVRALWLANRDLVARPEAPLRPGMVLRTPSLD